MPSRSYDVEIPIKAKNLTRRGVRDAERGLSRLERRMKALNRTGAKMQTIGREMSTIGRQAVLMGGAVASGLGVGIKMFSDFERRFGRIGTMLEGGVGQAFPLWAEDVKKLSVETGVRIADIQNAMFDAVSAGVPVGKVMDYITKTTKASVASFASLESIVDGTTTIMNAYGIEADKVLKITDQLMLANKVGKLTIQDLSSAIGQVASTAQQFGVSTDDMFASISAVTSVTGDVDRAVTGFNALLLQIAQPLDETIDFFDKLNKGVAENEKVWLGVEGIQKAGGFLKWYQRFMKLTGGNVHALQKLIGAQRQAGKFFRTLVTVGDKFTNTANSMEKANAKGELTMLKYAEASKLLANRIARIRQRLVVMVVDLTQKFAPEIEQFGLRIEDSLRRGAIWLDENRDKVKELITTGVKWTKILVAGGGLLWALGKITTAVGTLTKVVGGLRIAFTLLASHPVVAGLLAVAGIAIYATKKIRDMQKEASGNLTEGQIELAKKDPRAFAKNMADQRKANLEALAKANRKAQGIAGKKGIATPFFTREATKEDLISAGLQMPKVVNKVKKTEQKITKIKETEADKRIKKILSNLEKETNASKKSFEQIQLFGRARETFVTRRVLEGQNLGLGEKIAQATATGKKGANINIGRVELPNVQNVEEFTTELDLMSQGTGQSTRAGR